MKLDTRLAMVASFVEPDTVAADIGTDHGYLIAYLVKSGVINSGYATDINEMPLEAARRTIAEWGLEDSIQTLRCDGLSSLENRGIQCVVIAGLGGELIATMLEEAPWVKDERVSLVLQPMSRPEHLRSFLYQHGFVITKERAVASGHHVYSVIGGKYSGNQRTLSLREARLGRLEDWVDETTLQYFDKLKKRLAYEVRSEKNEEIAKDMRLLKDELGRMLKDAENQ